MTTTHTIETPVVPLPLDAALEDAAWHAVQACPKHREPTADEPYAPNPERSLVVPTCDHVDIDITDKLRALFQEDAKRFCGEHVTAERPVLVVEGGRVLARYSVRASE